MDTEEYWKLITGGIDLVNKEHQINKLHDVKIINYEIDEINLDIFYLVNNIESDLNRIYRNSKTNGNKKNIEKDNILCEEYTKKLIKLINRKKTCVFKKKIYSKNYN